MIQSLGFPNPTICLVLAILFLATFIRAALGFGEALVAVPLLAFILPIEVAAPLAVLVSVTVSCLVLGRDWRKVERASAGRLVLSTMVGIPLGLWLLTGLAEHAVKAILGAVIVGFSLYKLLTGAGKERVLNNDRSAWLFGLLAGVLGGAYGMNGPPLVVYGSLRGWDPSRFRATLQGYFLPASVAGLAGYAWLGLWTSGVTVLYLLALPVVLVATWLGDRCHRALPQRRFVQGVHTALAGVGLILLAQSLF